jgi:hypothetical protein
MKTKLFFALVASLFVAGTVGSVERVAYVERHVPKCYTDANGVTRCTMVTETVVTTVKDVTPLAVASSTLTVVPRRMHAHRMKDGSVMVHGDDNYGDPAAHVGVSGANWPKIAVAGQTVAVSTTDASCPTCPQTRSSAFSVVTSKQSVVTRSGAVFPRLSGVRARFTEWRVNRPRLLALFGGC